MRASQLEMRHPTLLHLLIVGAAWATYLFDPIDIVWRIIRGYPSRLVLEHIVFSLAAIIIGIGAILCTWARASMRQPDANDLIRAGFMGEWLYAIGLATLLPFSGCILLVTGESIRIVRIALSRQQPLPDAEDADLGPDRRWPIAIRRESVKWGIFATMIVFSICLIDRVADYGILASLLLWAVLSLPAQRICAAC